MKQLLGRLNYKKRQTSGFSLIEMLVVIVLIGILVTIAIVSYTGVADKANISSLQGELASNAISLKAYRATYGSFPTALDNKNCPSAPNIDNDYCIKSSSTNSFYSYTGSASNFTLQMKNGTKIYQVTKTGAPIEYIPYIQTITTANCPSTRTNAVDARDNHAYWVQKLADGKCWMLTNLGYAGGGTNTYNDIKTLTNGTGSAVTYTVASYYIVTNTTNYTTYPAQPSTSINGTGQYGYLYNWCAAMGAQTTTSACSGTSTTPAPVTSISICPYGWRLPVGSGGEFAALNTAINAGSTTSDAGLIASPWLGQRSGAYSGTFSSQGTIGYYWSSNQSSTSTAAIFYISSTSILTNAGNNKNQGNAVRCIAI